MAAGELGVASADELLAPVRETFAKLQQSGAVDRGDVEEGLRQLTEAAAGALRVARVGIWKFGEERTSIHCVAFFDQRLMRHAPGAVLRAEDAPAYFEALLREVTIAASDARRDPRTFQFEPTYLTPLGISALLDAPIWLKGRLIGVVCHEHVGLEPRAWTPWEELVAGTIADLVSIILGAAERAEELRTLQQRVVDQEHWLESAPLGLALFDRDARYTRVNGWMATWHGKPVAEVMGRRPRDVIGHSETVATFESAIAATFASGRASEITEVSMRATDASATLLVRFYPVVVGGAVQQVGCYVVDIGRARAR